MTKSIRRLIGLGFSLAIILGFSVAFYGQIRINVPKIPKIPNEKEQPTTPGRPGGPPTTSPPSSSTSDPVSSQGSQLVKNGKPISGAKVYFSTAPFTNSSAGARSTFTSQEFIYGRLELNQSISDAFGLGNMPKRDYYYVKYYVLIGDNVDSSIGPHTGNHLFLSKEDVSKNYLNFDVLPDANNINTVLAVVDELWNYKFPANLVSEHDVRSKFPKNGDYPIRIILFQANFDDYGQQRFDSDPLPYAAGQFTFQFAARDWDAMNANHKKAFDNAESARNKRDTVRALPDWWGKTKPPTDPKLSAARMTALINDYAKRWGRTYLGKFAWDSYSLPIWNIQNNDLGLPSYRYGPHIWVVYRDDKDGMCYFGSHSIREDYSGAGTYGQTYLNTMSNRTYIDCAAVR
jgi:hypothetical protein